MPRAVSATPEQKAFALLINDRLCAEYGCPIPYFHSLDPLSELVSSLLSHRTKNADSGRAFRTLRDRWSSDWTAVRDAPTAEVEEAISACTWPEQKAPRLQAVLKKLTELRGGDLSLDFLEAMSVKDARSWLEQLPGVGPKTSAAVLVFSRLRMPALPVDSHHHRVAQRLGLIPASVDVGPAHALLEAQLPPEWDAQQVYDNHEVLMLHGQKLLLSLQPLVFAVRRFRRVPVRAGAAQKDRPVCLNAADGMMVVMKRLATALLFFLLAIGLTLATDPHAPRLFCRDTGVVFAEPFGGEGRCFCCPGEETARAFPAAGGERTRRETKAHFLTSRAARWFSKTRKRLRRSSGLPWTLPQLRRSRPYPPLLAPLF